MMTCQAELLGTGQELGRGAAFPSACALVFLLPRAEGPNQGLSGVGLFHGEGWEKWIVPGRMMWVWGCQTVKGTSSPLRLHPLCQADAVCAVSSVQGKGGWGWEERRGLLHCVRDFASCK